MDFRSWVLEPVIDRITELRENLMDREAENYAKLTATVESVKSAFTSQRTEIEQLRAALEQADADAVRRVDEALAADSEHDADAIAAVDASLSELVPGQPVEVPSDSDGGETPVDPADETQA